MAGPEEQSMRLTRKHRWLLTGGLTALLTVASGAWWSQRARASGIPAPNALHYAGTLSEKGVPVDGPRDVTIVIWKDAQSTAGTDQLCITQAGSTPIAAGRFEVPLVDDCTSKLAANPDSWAEVQVGGVSYGRQKIGAVPYAVISSAVDGTVKSTGILPRYTTDGALGRGDGDASLYNDGTLLHELAIRGNTSGGGVHKIGLYDDVSVAGALSVGGSLAVTGQFLGDGNFAGKLSASSTPPNYDSKWRAITETDADIAFTHNFGQIAARFTLLICGNATGTSATSLDNTTNACTTRVITTSAGGYQDASNAVNPLTVTQDVNNIYVAVYGGWLLYDYWAPGRGWACPTSGTGSVNDCNHAYYRVLAWKGF
jgi:hypothetical protein